MINNKVIGIDLGTTNSCMAAIELGTPTVVPNAEGSRTTPSIVSYSKQGEILIGDAAKRQATANPKQTISSIKRHMGTEETFQLGEHSLRAQEISAMVLRKLKKDAEEKLGTTISQAVITVPAYFTDAQRQATKDAGRIAGLEVLRIINEPTAAALAYGLEHAEPQKVLVYDLGGGTFDVSLIEISEGLIEVLATAGNNQLGGDDFDEALTEYVMESYRRTHRINLAKDPSAVRRIREACEEAKKGLSTSNSVSINLPFIASIKGEPIHLYIDISRSEFEQLTKELVQRTSAPMLQVLQDANVKPSELGKVLLVGGSTRIPAVQELVREVTGLEPSKSLNPDECVALGAAIQAGKLSGELFDGDKAEMILMDVTPFSLAIETVGGIATTVIERNSPIPTRHRQVFSTAANFQTAVDIHILQGEGHYAKQNHMIGNFRLNGIKRALAGVPQIEVTFELDVNGILKVSAKDLQSGKEKGITITSSSNMTEEEIDEASKLNQMQ